MKYVIVPILFVITLFLLLCLFVLGLVWHASIYRGGEFMMLLDKPSAMFLEYNFPKIFKNRH